MTELPRWYSAKELDEMGRDCVRLHKLNGLHTGNIAAVMFYAFKAIQNDPDTSQRLRENLRLFEPPMTLGLPGNDS